MKRESPTYALSILFDLAATLAVPRISKHIPKLQWPALSVEERAEMDALASGISTARSFDCANERWPFHAGAEKLVSVASTLAAIQETKSDSASLTVCYVKEYFLELAFQRFFAWSVHNSANDTTSNIHYHYRNAYANARSVLAMPLLVDLAWKTEVLVSQGNFGHRPSRTQPWVYPHLSHYLSAFYYPWIPNTKLPQATDESAMDRAIKRSQQICGEISAVIKNGYALRKGQYDQKPLELEEILNRLNTAENRVAISPFVATAISNTQLLGLLEEMNPDAPTSAFQHFLLNDKDVRTQVESYLEPISGGNSPSYYQRFLQTCQRNLDISLSHEIGVKPGESFFIFNPAELTTYLMWRSFEERLRLVLDCLLLYRRFYDPTLTRSRYSSKFENIGFFAIEIPEINFNLLVQDFNNGELGTERSGNSAGWEECRRWITEAGSLASQDTNDLWAEGKFPYHALFEAYLLETGESQFDPFWMALLLAHLVPPVGDSKTQEDRARFRKHLEEKWASQWVTILPFAALEPILAEKRAKMAKKPDTYGEDCKIWLWLEEKLSKLLAQEKLPDWSDVTLEEVVKRIFDKVPQPWVTPDFDLQNELRVLRERKATRRDLTRDDTLDLETEEDGKIERLRKARNDIAEEEERGRLFFSYGAFFGVNTTIFRALTDLDFARNFITIRLIATERASTTVARPLENQDHADFVGTYVVWKKDDDSESAGSYLPRHDAWREAKALGLSTTGEVTRNWLSDLHNLKLLVKNLGISLLNQERIKEQERLNALLRKETARSTIAGIMARNMSHNIGSHVLASSGLLKGVHIDEIEKLHNFLQQRMDFIAQVVTYTPSWGEPMFFFKDLLGEFFNQYLLLSNLIKDQGYPQITFFVSMNRHTFVFERKTLCSKCEKASEACTCATNDAESRLKGGWQLKDDDAHSTQLPEVLVAVPGGAIGAHAFYIILENMLRNSAKYGHQQAQKEGLKVYIDLEDEEDFYQLKIWDNTGRRDQHIPEDVANCECRVCVVQRRLQDELIDPESGTVTEKSRGIHEMKECAAILINPHLEAVGKRVNGKSVALWADAEKRDGGDYLRYGIALQKPRLVGIVDIDGKPSAQAKTAGVFHYKDIESLARYPHQLGLIYLRAASRDDTLEYIEKHHYLLPYRLLLIDKSGGGRVEVKPNPRRAQWCDVTEPIAGERIAWEGFVVELWETWLRRFKNPAGGKWQMMVSFERDESHAVFKRWVHSLENNFTSDLVDVYLTRGRDHVFSAVVHPNDTSRQDLQSKIKGFESSWIIFDNHGTGFTFYNDGSPEDFGNKNSLRSYQDFGSKQSIRLYQTLESPPASEFVFKLFILGLVESSLMRVVIIDERVADAVYDKEKGFRTGLMRDLRWAGCAPVFSIWTEPAEESESNSRRFVSETIRQRNDEAVKLKIARIDDREGVYLMENPEIKIHVPASRKTLIDELDPHDGVDTIIIHQGVIDVLDQNHVWLGEGHNDYHLELLHRLSPSIIITSGRGRTIRHIENKEIPFLEFSIVKDNTYAGLSKYHLVRSLLSVAGERQVTS